MASDLATALLSGQNAGSLAADPALLAITPQLQLAQALSTQGMSTAPAAPAQASGRLAQALAGAKINVDAQEDFAKANAGATAWLYSFHAKASARSCRAHAGALARRYSAKPAGDKR